jgi:hypothetical protein
MRGEILIVTSLVMPAKAGIHAESGRVAESACSSVMPAKAGIHAESGRVAESAWAPAFGFPSKYYFDGFPPGATGRGAAA